MVGNKANRATVRPASRELADGIGDEGASEAETSTRSSEGCSRVNAEVL